MELRPATGQSDLNITQRVDPESVRDLEQTREETENEIKRNERSRVQPTETLEQTAVRHAKDSERKELQVIRTANNNSETTLLTEDTAGVMEAENEKNEIKRSRAEREVRRLETPEQSAARRAKASESQRRRRAQLQAEKRAIITLLAQIPNSECSNETKTSLPLGISEADVIRLTNLELRRVEKLRELREARKMEAPAKAAERRAKAAAGQRKRRELLRAARELETPEETAARLAKEAEQAKTLTPQQAAARRARRAENIRKRRQLKALNSEETTETRELFVARRERATKLQRNKRAQLRAAMADQKRKEKEMRLERCEAKIRNSTSSAEDDLNRLEKIRKLGQARKMETLEQAAARRARSNEYQRRRREQLRVAREAETPEQTAARLAKEAELREAKIRQQHAKRSECERRSQQGASKPLQDRAVSETPEEAATRRAKAVAKARKKRHDNPIAQANAIERKRHKRKLLQETETPEQCAARRAKATENRRRRKEQKRATSESNASALETLATERNKRLKRALAYANAIEKKRQKRILLRETETPEQAAERRAKAAESEKLRRQRRAFACLHDSTLAFKYKIKRMERLRALREARKKETPEQATARREKAAMGRRRRREQLHASRETDAPAISWMQRSGVSEKEMPYTRSQNLTAEEIAARRMKVVERNRKRREQLLSETPEEKQARILVKRERIKISREKVRAENKLARQIKSQQKKDAANLKRVEKEGRIAEKRRIRREKIAKETPERKATRLELKRQNYKKLRAKETPEEHAARRAKRAAQMREKKQMLKKAARVTTKKPNTTEDYPVKVFVVKLEDIDFDESRTGSFLEPSEGNFSITTDASFNFTATTNGSQSAQQDSEGSTTVKEEPSQDSWSSFKISESSYVTQEMSQPSVSHEGPEKKRIKTDDDTKLPEDLQTTREEYAVYGEYLADKFRKCNRNSAEINVARKLIESIMCNLSAGVYSSVNSDDTNGLDEDEKPLILATPPVVAPVVQAIIVKEEVDL